MNWWNVNLPKWTGDNFRNISPERVLVEYDGLLTFTFRDASGNMMLAHLAAENETKSRYVVAPTSELGIRRLVNGTVSLLGALSQPIIWLIEYDGGSVLDCWSGTIDKLPNSILPLEDAMLYAHLEPLIKLKAPGERFRIGAVATGALSAMIASAENAINVLINHVDAKRMAAYQVEAQQLQFNSIEIAFKAIPKDETLPMFGEVDTTLPRVEKMLADGFKWLATDGGHQLPSDDEKAILSAIRELTPKKGGPIARLEVTGRATDEKTITLTNDVRRKIATKIRLPKSNAISPIGRIRELDADSQTFELRDISEGSPLNSDHVRFVFGNEDREDVYNLFKSESIVRADGELEGTNRYRLIDLSEIKESSPSLPPDATSA